MLVGLVAAGCTPSTSAPARGRGAVGASTDPAQLVGDFLGRYKASDGRIVRWDQGGDTVSEGQAYALLMTAAIGDRPDFEQVWTWTASHLQEPDGLLAWRYAGGRIVGTEPATDADLGAAAALALGSSRFHDPVLLTAARRMASAIARAETVPAADGPTLVAGPWAAEPVPYVNPSYLSSAEMDQLARSVGGAWPAVEAASDAELEELTTNGNLPSDWAVVGSDRHVHPTSPPGERGQPVIFGYDALRVPLWLASSCSATMRASAADLLPALRRGGGRVELDLGGTPAPGQDGPAGLLPLAAAYSAAGDSSSATAALRQAITLNSAHPTYYGSVLIVITELGLDGLLERCA